MYDVNKDLIRAANDFTGDEVFMFKELKIPNTNGPLDKEIEWDPVKEEQERRKCAVAMMSEILKESCKDQIGDFKAEARFYLDHNNFDVQKALEEFKKDEAFEKHVEERNSGFRVIYTNKRGRIEGPEQNECCVGCSIF